MIPSEEVGRRAQQIVDRLTQLLDESRLCQRIDEPIDQAMAQWKHPEDLEYSHRQFHETIARCLQYVLERAEPGGRRPSLEEAHDEAVALLEHGYEGTRADGYYGAVVDAAGSSRPGLPWVLAGLADALKAHRRQIYIRWVIASHVDPADWPTRCAVAAILIARCRQWLPPELRPCRPEQLVDDLPELLSLGLARVVPSSGSLPF